MATATAIASRRIVSLVLQHLSNMKYKDRQQRGPDQPVEFLEFRPTLVPSILVHKLWQDEGTSLLWKRYPHLPALKQIDPSRRQWYANKVECLFVLAPGEEDVNLAYLHDLDWPNLKSLEMEVDWETHGSHLTRMLHAGLEHVELLGAQKADPTYFATALLPALLKPCNDLQSIHITPGAISQGIPVHSRAFSELLASRSNLRSVRIFNVNFSDKNFLFDHFTRMIGLETLEIDLDPGLHILPLLATPTSVLFPTLKRLHVMCYPEVAIALPAHLPHIEELEIDVARIPDQAISDTDISVMDDVISALTSCPWVRLLRINVGPLAVGFPTTTSLPVLEGASLVELAKSCPMLQELTLLASEPAAIDASRISEAQFDEFCARAGRLRYLSLKLQPTTAVTLEDCALQSLAKYCLELEVLRMKVSLQIPSLTRLADAFAQLDTSIDSSIDNSQPRHDPSLDIDAAHENLQPLFPNLTHLAFSRPSTILSVAASTYLTLISSDPASIDPDVEVSLVQSWAHSFITHFPALEILEAWSDWAGADNDSLNYFLPCKEPLASTWEFLSGMEQDLWDDGGGSEVEFWDADFEEGISFESSSADWEKASLSNEFSEEGLGHVLEEEPVDMVTPGKYIGDAEYFVRAGHETVDEYDAI